MTGEARPEEIFPTLAAEQVEKLRHLGHERALAAGELLFSHGAEDVPFYVVVEGGLDMVSSAGGKDQLVVTHVAGSFLGDVDMLSGRPTVVSAHAKGPTRVIEIDRERLQSLVQYDSELSDIILRAFILRRIELIARGQGGLVLVGSSHSAETLHLQSFLTRNGRPYAYIDVERDPAVQELLDHLHVTVDDIPLLFGSGEDVLKKPTIEQVAECCGLSRINTADVHDLVIVGAGPAGLAAAVYAASEGLDVVVLEGDAPGGQAGTSSKIENYLGFPTGISGQAGASAAFVQAEKFGAHISVARTATKLGCGMPFGVELAGGAVVQARTVIIASGVTYRRPEVAELARFVGAGVYFAATALEGNLCRGEEIAIIGGGNSAGQAAVFLARSAAKVHVMVRGPGLAESMSKYLIRRIEETPNIDLRTQTQIASLDGAAHVEHITCVDAARREQMTLPIRHVFIMTGADPNTDWLARCVTLDDKGFVKTGVDLTPEELTTAAWPLGRSPYPNETSIPHVFAVGDVRSGSIKRVAAAVGEGSACVQAVHKALAE